MILDKTGKVKSKEREGGRRQKRKGNADKRYGWIAPKAIRSRENRTDRIKGIWIPGTKLGK